MCHEYRTIGYFIHPSIRQRLGANARIADVGTRTGAWLLALSREMPATVQLDGYDPSDVQFPDQRDLPPNVSFTIADARKPFPLHLHGTYDVVHVRLQVSAMERDHWLLMADHCSVLLKPGGSIQWEEPDLWNIRILRERVDSQTDALFNLHRYWQSSLGERFLYGYSTLPATFQRLGLLDVCEDVVATDRLIHNRTPCARLSAQGILGWARIRAEHHEEGALSVEQVDQLERDVRRDFESGAYSRYDIFVIMGSKKL